MVVRPSEGEIPPEGEVELEILLRATCECDLDALIEVEISNSLIETLRVLAPIRSPKPVLRKNSLLDFGLVRAFSLAALKLEVTNPSDLPTVVRLKPLPRLLIEQNDAGFENKSLRGRAIRGGGETGHQLPPTLSVEEFEAYSSDFYSEFGGFGDICKAMHLTLFNDKQAFENEELDEKDLSFLHQNLQLTGAGADARTGGEGTTAGGAPSSVSFGGAPSAVVPAAAGLSDYPKLCGPVVRKNMYNCGTDIAGARTGWSVVILILGRGNSSWTGWSLAPGAFVDECERAAFFPLVGRTWIFGRCIESDIRFSIHGVGWWGRSRVVG